MKNLLQQIDTNILVQIIGLDRVNKIKSILDDCSYDVDIPEIALAIFGQNILENSSLRKEIIKVLPEKVLSELTKKHCGKAYSSKEANAIQLSAKSWTSSGKLPYDIILELGISRDYLPKRTQRHNTVEMVESIDKYFPLFEYQHEVKNNILEKIDDSGRRFIVQMPTGSGKTKTCLEALINYNSLNPIFECNRSIIWIAHTEELCEQAIASLKTIWKNTQIDALRLIRFWGGYEPTEEELYGSFIFSTYQKLSSRKSDYFVNIMSQTCKITVVDEAHKAIATTYGKMLNRMCQNDSVLIGLTATPGRSSTDLMNNTELVQYFNKQIIVPPFQNNPIEALRDMNILSNISHSTIESQIQVHSEEGNRFDSNFDFSYRQLQLLSINTERNRLIIRILKKEVADKNPCLVFTCSTEHSVILTGVLKFLGIKATYVDSKLKKSRRRQIIADFKEGNYDVLLNFGVLTTGFDAPRIKTILITRPTTSIVLYSQMIGRGLRGVKVGGNELCKIIDIKDNYRDFGKIEEIYNFFAGYWN